MPTLPNVKRNKKGITLIELLIVVAIVTILSLAIIPSYSEFSRRKDFTTKAETFVNEVLNIRNKALAGAVFTDGTGPHEANWGLSPTCNGSTYTTGHRLLPAGPYFIDTTNTLPEGVIFANGACSPMMFKRLDGAPETAGTITLKYGTLTKSITVNSSGRIVYD